MKVAFYAPDGNGDKLLVAGVMHGAHRHGDEVKYIPVGQFAGVVEEADAVACYGVRASTRIIVDAYTRAGKRFLYFDKGYWGRGRYTRVAIDAWQPTEYFRDVALGDSRLHDSGLEITDVWSGCGKRTPNDIIYAATTQTWCDFYNLGPARALDEIIVKLLVAGEATSAVEGPQSRVVYRPRPAYAKKHPELAQPIEGAWLSDHDEPLAEALKRCRLLVTLGSNAAIEARAAGVATLVLSDNPAKVLNNRLIGEVERLEFFRQLAWTQWTLEEYMSGVAWEHIKETMRRRTA